MVAFARIRTNRKILRTESIWLESGRCLPDNVQLISALIIPMSDRIPADVTRRRRTDAACKTNPLSSPSRFLRKPTHFLERLAETAETRSSQNTHDLPCLRPSDDSESHLFIRRLHPHCRTLMWIKYTDRTLIHATTMVNKLRWQRNVKVKLCYSERRREEVSAKVGPQIQLSDSTIYLLLSRNHQLNCIFKKYVGRKKL